MTAGNYNTTGQLPGSSWELIRDLPVQVGTEDGRVKVVGADGVELLLGIGGSGACTHQLVTAAHRAGIVRLDKVTCCILA